MSDGFGFIARDTESIWMLSYLMQICIKAAFTHTTSFCRDGWRNFILVETFLCIVLQCDPVASFSQLCCHLPV